MKKFLIAGLFSLALTTSVFAASDPEVNSQAVAHLEANYTDVKDVSWTVKDEFERASFTKGKEKVDIYYDANGEVIGTFTSFAYDKLPKAALDILTTQYTFPVYQLKDCIAFTDADNRKNYYVSFEVKNETVVLEISTKGTVNKVRTDK